jgi:hypothetical protein
MPVEPFPVDEVRRSLESLPETMAATTTEQPDPPAMFVVLGHERALDPESTIVVGDRGTGKSFWSAALNSSVTRGLIHGQLPRLRLDRVETSWGFSVSTRNQDHPSRRVLRRLKEEGYSTEDIWRAVILHQLMARYLDGLPANEWVARVRYVAENPEREEGILNQISDRLRTENKRHLIVFDALDRTGVDWKAIRELVRSLLQVCLDLNSQPSIKTKIFLRPDMWEDRTIWQFPDSSKLHHGRVNLEWRRVDLYGLLWHWLCNHGATPKCFRDWLAQRHGLRFEATKAEGIEVYPIPQRLRQDETLQQAVLHDMATQYMGTNRRRGKTYTWLPNHLADAKGQVSPRSFLIAIREAQRETRMRGHKEVLHWEGIKRGVQDASRVRVQELGEDYPWIQTVLEPLRGQTVPCRDEEIERRWSDANVVETIEQKQAALLEDEQSGAGLEEDGRFYLPPHALNAPGFSRGESALIQELQRIGVIRRVNDDRVDIPDLFRVAASIGRRGGVRPIQ